MVSYAGTARFVATDETAHRFVLEANGRETRGSGTAAATGEATMQEEGPSTRVTLLTDLDITGKPAQFGRGASAATCRGRRRGNAWTSTSRHTASNSAASDVWQSGAGLRGNPSPATGTITK